MKKLLKILVSLVLFSIMLITVSLSVVAKNDRVNEIYTLEKLSYAMEDYNAINYVECGTDYDAQDYSWSYSSQEYLLSENPKLTVNTGDNTNYIIIIAFMAVSLAAIIIIIVFKSKKK